MPQIANPQLKNLQYIEEKDATYTYQTAVEFNWQLGPQAMAGTEASLTLPEELSINTNRDQDKLRQDLGQIKDQAGLDIFNVYISYINFKETIILQVTENGAAQAAKNPAGLSGSALLGQRVNRENLARIDDVDLARNKDYKNPAFRGLTYKAALHAKDPEDKADQKKLTFTINSQGRENQVKADLKINQPQALTWDKLFAPIYSYGLTKEMQQISGLTAGVAAVRTNPVRALQAASDQVMGPNSREGLAPGQAVTTGLDQAGGGMAPQQTGSTAPQPAVGNGNLKAALDKANEQMAISEIERTGLPKYRQLITGLLNINKKDAKDATKASLYISGLKDEEMGLTLYTMQDGRKERIYPVRGADFLTMNRSGFDIDLLKLQAYLEKEQNPQAGLDEKSIYYEIEGTKENPDRETLALVQLMAAAQAEQAIGHTGTESSATEQAAGATAEQTAGEKIIISKVYKIATTSVNNGPAEGDQYTTSQTSYQIKAQPMSPEEIEAAFPPESRQPLQSAENQGLQIGEENIPGPMRGPGSIPGNNNLKPGMHGTTREQFPVEIEYHTHQYVYHKDPNQWGTDYTNDKMVWDIELDIDDLASRDDLDFSKLVYSLYASENQSLKDYKVSFASTKEELLTPGQGAAFTSNSPLAIFNTEENKATLANKRFIRVSASFDMGLQSGKNLPANPQNGQYTLGLRVSPDKNYVLTARDEFMAAYQRLSKIPLVITWVQGLDKTKPYENGFNLVDARFASAVFVGDYEYETEFYADKTRSITGRFRPDASGKPQAQWEVIDLLRLTDQVDDKGNAVANNGVDININDATFTKAGGRQGTGRLTGVIAYIPNDPSASSGYRKVVISDTSKEGLKNWLAQNRKPGIILVYSFTAESDTVYEKNTITIDFRQKWDDELGTTGGVKRASIREFSQAEKDSEYYAIGGMVNSYALVDKTFNNNKDYVRYRDNRRYYGATMQIDKTGELAFCFNLEKSFYQTDFGKLGLNQNEVENSYMLNAVADPGPMSREDALLKLRKIFFYADQLQREYMAAHNGKKMNTTFYYALIQDLIHYYSTEKGGNSSSYVLSTLYSRKQYTVGGKNQVAPWWEAQYDDRYEDSPSATADYFMIKRDGARQTVGDGSRTYSDIYHATFGQELDLINKIDTAPGWTKDKEDAIRIRLYSHKDMDKIQALVTGDVPLPIDFAKLAENDKGLAGAKFAIYDQAGNLRKEWVSRVDGQGNPIHEDIYLREGQYILKEVETPQGRQSIGEVPFEVKFNQEFHWTETFVSDALRNLIRKDIDSESYNLYISGQNIPYSKDRSTPLISYQQMNMIVKNLFDNTAELNLVKTGLDGRVIDGAIFSLTSHSKKADGTPLYEKTLRGEKGHYSFIGLTEGDYTLEEIQQPSGYQLPDPHSWTVQVRKSNDDPKNPDKLKATIVGLNAGSLDQYEIKNEPIKTELKFRKVDKDNQAKGLEGAVFDLTQTKGGNYSKQAVSDVGMVKNPNYKPGSTVPSEKYPLVQDPAKVGYFTFSDLTVGEYILTEISAPNGYEQNHDTWRLVVGVDANGNLTKTLYHRPAGPNGGVQIGPDGKIVENLVSGVNDITEGFFYKIDNIIQETQVKLGKYKGDKVMAQVDGKPTEWQRFTYGELLDGRDNKAVQFKIYETNYYGNRIGPDRIINPTQDTNGDGYFLLDHLKVGGYYVLEEINTPKGYGPDPAAPNDPSKPKLVWNIKVILDNATGKPLVILSHPDNSVIIDNHQISGIKNYPQDSQKGRLETRKIGKDPYTGLGMGLRRAHIRLYELDEQVPAGSKKFKRRLDGGGFFIYQERLTSDGDMDGDGKLTTQQEKDRQGWAIFGNLEPGFYELTESMSPAGYKKEGTSWLVEVKNDGTTSWYKVDYLKNEDGRTFHEGMKYYNDAGEEDPVNGICDLSGYTPNTGQQGEDQLIVDSRNFGDKLQSFNTSAQKETGSNPTTFDITNTLVGRSDTIIQPKNYRIILALDQRSLVGSNGSHNYLIDNKIRKLINDIKVKAGQIDDQIELAILNYGYWERKRDGSYVYPDLQKDVPLTNFVKIDSNTDINTVLGQIKNRRKTMNNKTWIQSGFESLVNNLSVRTFGVNNSGGREQKNIFINMGVREFQRPDQDLRQEKEYFNRGIKTFNTSLCGLAFDNVDVWYMHFDVRDRDKDNDLSWYTSSYNTPEIKTPLKTDHVSWQSYDGRTGTYRNENALDAFLAKIVDAIKPAPKAEGNVKDGTYEIKVKSGFEYVPGSATFTLNGEGQQPTLTQTADGFKISGLNLSTQESLQVSYRIKQKAGTNLPEGNNYLYDASLTAKPGDNIITVQDVNYRVAKHEDTSGVISIWNADEDLSRIPLRITKVDKNGRVKSQTQFRLKKNMDKQTLSLYQNFRDYKVPYDAVAAATGQPGDYYFRELTPGEYTLTEEKTPDGYQPPVDENGQPMHWIIKVTQHNKVDSQGKPVLDKNGNPVLELQVHLPGDREAPFGTKYTPPAGISEIPKAKYLIGVEDDGRTPPARPDAPYQTIREAQITNYKKTADLAFQKRNEDGTATLPGAEFQLTGQVVDRSQSPDASGKYPTKPFNNGQPLTVISDENGIVFRDLPEGSYTITEIKAPDGYQLPPEGKNIWKVSLEWNKKGELVPVWKESGANGEDGRPLGDYYTVKDPVSREVKVRIKNQRSSIELKLDKVKASDGTPLLRSDFRLEKLDKKGGQAVYVYPYEAKEVTSNRFVFKNLTKGFYRLTETLVADGYLKPEPWEFEVAAMPDGTLYFKFNKNPGRSDYEIYNVDGTKFTGGAGGTNENPPAESEHDEFPDGKIVRIKNYQPINYEFRKVNGSRGSLVGAEFSLKRVENPDETKLSYGYHMGQTDEDSKATCKFKDNNPANTDPNNRELYRGYGYYHELKGDKNYYFKFNNLTEGKYELTEITMPDGVRLPKLKPGTGDRPTWYIKVRRGENGLVLEKEGSNILPSAQQQDPQDVYSDNYEIVKYTSYDPQGKEITTSEILIRNYVSTTDMTFTKIADSLRNDAIAGAEFTLQRYDSNPRTNPSAQLTGDVIYPEGYKDENGNLTNQPLSFFRFKGLEKGWYRLTETKSPDGFIPNKKGNGNWWTYVLVDKDGKGQFIIRMPELEDFYKNNDNKQKFHEYIQFGNPGDTSGPLFIVNYQDMKIKIKKLGDNNELINKDWTAQDNQTKRRTLDLKLEKKLDTGQQMSAEESKALAEVNKKLIGLDLTKQTADGFDIDIPYPMSGEYYLTEERAPEGYLKNYDKYLINIDREHGTIRLQAVLDPAGNERSYKNIDKLSENPLTLWLRKETDSDKKQPLELINHKVEFPKSGGKGTKAFILAGAAISMTALLGWQYKLIRRRKKEGGLYADN